MNKNINKLLLLCLAVAAAGANTRSWGAIDLGDVAYGTEKTSYFDVSAKALLIPATTLRNIQGYSAIYRYRIVVGHGRATAEYMGRVGWENFLECGRNLSGNLTGSCTDKWNRYTGNDGRCRGLLAHGNSWVAGTGVKVEGGDANAMASWMDKQMKDNIARMRFPDAGREWQPPGKQSQSVIIDNGNVMIKWNPNGGADIKGAWCVEKAWPIGG
ncbi:hypothetical protein QRG94_004849 [Salmonella enterica]|nr:hypothetical protein [Salmonella enterica]